VTGVLGGLKSWRRWRLARLDAIDHFCPVCPGPQPPRRWADPNDDHSLSDVSFTACIAIRLARCQSASRARGTLGSGSSPAAIKNLIRQRDTANLWIMPPAPHDFDLAVDRENSGRLPAFIRQSLAGGWMVRRGGKAASAASSTRRRISADRSRPRSSLPAIHAPSGALLTASTTSFAYCSISSFIVSTNFSDATCAVGFTSRSLLGFLIETLHASSLSKPRGSRQ